MMNGWLILVNGRVSNGSLVVNKRWNETKRWSQWWSSSLMTNWIWFIVCSWWLLVNDWWLDCALTNGPFDCDHWPTINIIVNIYIYTHTYGGFSSHTPYPQIILIKQPWLWGFPILRNTLTYHHSSLVDGYHSWLFQCLGHDGSHWLMAGLCSQSSWAGAWYPWIFNSKEVNNARARRVALQWQLMTGCERLVTNVGGRLILLAAQVNIEFPISITFNKWLTPRQLLVTDRKKSMLVTTARCDPASKNEESTWLSLINQA